VIGMGAGWITGTVTGPALLLRLLGVRLAAGRVILAILAGALVSGLLVYTLEAFRAGTHPLAYSMRVLAGLSSASTFVGFVLAARERPDP